MSLHGINKLTIIGAGLIGGSVARALKKQQAVQTICAYSRHEAHLQAAKSLGVIDDYQMDLASAVASADLILVATPVGSFEQLFPLLALYAEDKAIITDAGSTKTSVIEMGKKYLGTKLTNFVPGHPIAGTEQSGVGASFDTLFENKKVILTPIEETCAQALDVVRAMWIACGAEVHLLSAHDHDKILAQTSHLPHVLAYVLVNALGEQSDGEQAFQFAAGGFKDFTRIASSDPIMWRDICLHNRVEILNAIELYKAELSKLQRQIEHADDVGLQAAFEHAKQKRTEFLNWYLSEPKP